MSIGSILIVFNDRGRRVDGIRDHTSILEYELARASGLRVRSFLHLTARSSAGFGLRRLLGTGATSGDRTVVIVQYSPFCYGRWGFAPWLPLQLLALRLSRNRPLVVLNVHEPYVSMTSWRSTVMGLWQRWQLAALRVSADVVFSSIESWSVAFRRKWPRQPVHHLPVGSNLPDRRTTREAERARMALDGDALILACFGRDHPAWMPEYVVRAANALSNRGHPTVVLSLGAEAPLIRGLDPSVMVVAPGYLEAEALAQKLSAADIFISPLLDGVSTRRGTVMAALQHAVPVVGTVGPLTDSILSRSTSALSLVRVGDPDEFAEAVLRLADDPEARQSTGSAGHQLYERCFDWPVATERILAELTAASSP